MATVALNLSGGELGTIPGTYGTKFGAFLDGTPLGTSAWVDSVAEWEALTGIPLSATRRYAGTDYTVGPTLTAMAAAGVRICLSYSPPYSPTSSTDRDSIGAALATLKAMGADVQVALHHEPFFGGLTSTQYVNMVNYYGPTVRQYYPLWCVFSGDDTDEANGYYPGDGTVDGIAVDQYSTSTTWLTQGEAMADGHGLPLGLWEFNAVNDFGIDPSPVNSVTHAAGTTFLIAVRDFFAARAAAGKPNGDVLYFSATGGTTGTQSFLGDAFSQNGGFEGGIGNWVAGTGNTAAASSAQAHSGTSSLLLTCTTAGTIAAAHCATANITTQGVPCTAGDTVAFSCWFRPDTTARFAQGGVLWYNAAGTFLSTSFASSVLETAGAWKFYSGTAVAPATAAFAKFNPQVTSVALGEKHYLDDPQIGVLSASIDHTAPIQYPWDYRIASLASIRATLEGTGGDYLYDGQSSLDALAALGVKHVTVGVKMDRLQPTPATAFAPAEVGRLDAFVDRVAAAGMTCKLRVHNFGRRVVSGTTYVLGTAGYTQDDHADFFSRLAARYAGEATVTQIGYWQPHDLTAAPVFVPARTRYDWEAAVTPTAGFGLAPFGTSAFGG